MTTRSRVRRSSCLPSCPPHRSCSTPSHRSSTIAAELGRAYGEAVVGFDEFAESGDDLAFAEEFDRLPDAEARLLGRSLGEMQSQLSPTEVDGAREADDRSGDIRFGLQLSRAAIQAMDPDATARQQALAILPFSVQDLTGFDEIAGMLAAGDLQALEARIDEALSDAGAAELVSSVANAISQRLPVVDDVDYSTEFFSGYGATECGRRRRWSARRAEPSLRP